MPTFRYQARTRGGETRSGTLDADSLLVARQRLKSESLLVTSLKPAGKASLLTSTGERVSKRELLLLTTQLSIMNKSGVELTESLKSVGRQLKCRKLADAVERVVEKIEDGQSFSQALSSQQQIFGQAYVASIAAGESSGNLSGVLNRLTTLLRNEVRLWETIKSILTYPAVLLVVAGLVINALLFFVLPQFGKVFRDLERVPPVTTQVLLAVAEFMRGHWWLMPLGIIGGIALAAYIAQTKTARLKFDSLLLTLPGVRGCSRSLLAGRTFRLIGTMIQSGIPVLEAVKLCRRSISNRMYQNLFDNIEEELTNGNDLSLALQGATFLPAGVAQMIATSERSGDLGGVMEIVGEYYEDEGERNVRELAKIIEPVIIVVMGGFVALVVLSVILPLLDVTSASGG